MKNTKFSEAKNRFMLNGSFKKKGYDWWWHSLTAVNEETGEQKPFFFEYFCMNPGLGGKAPVFGQLPENKKKGVRPSYLMIKAGCWGHDHKVQLHRFFGWDDVKIKKGRGFKVQAADCYCDEHTMRGSIHVDPEEAKSHPEWMCDGGDISWDIKIEPQITFDVGYGTSELFLALKAFDMYWHAQGIKTYYTGTITVDGVRYKVEPETCNGYEDKNWGRDFTTPWVWLSSWDITSNITGEKLPDTAFEVGGGRPVVFRIPLNRKLLGTLFYKGKETQFNFSKFWTLSTTKFSYDETDTQILWHVHQTTARHVLDTEIQCDKADMLLVNYEDPVGEKRFGTLWNGGNGWGNLKFYKKRCFGLLGKKLIDDMSIKRVGCEYGEYDY